ncbi:uncharacterized protein LOC109802937 [Cajanus cajan]|uniref:uncharacterized protein LOC109799954 n=1 Tax=Cajanus cajan TaxID=3821 RepID=UPI00098D7670|nr:uncharacterized protein LOC109799954 [Cajanus cajan]XP_020217185.1 uncharacterized protein LOC109800738 [Cajanus cajan]XP_020219958.1 uncharacterized protein LOC109802937 [Cajanus cajan]
MKGKSEIAPANPRFGPLRYASDAAAPAATKIRHATAATLRGEAAPLRSAAIAAAPTAIDYYDFETPFPWTRNSSSSGCKCYINIGNSIFCIFGSGGILPSQTFPCSLCVLGA